MHIVLILYDLLLGGERKLIIGATVLGPLPSLHLYTEVVKVVCETPAPKFPLPLVRAGRVFT